MLGPIEATRENKPNRSTADEDNPERDRKGKPERIHLIPPTSQEERPTGASADQILARDKLGPLGATKRNKPNKITADEEDSYGDRKGTPRRIHLLPPRAREERLIGASADQCLARHQLGPIGATKKDKCNKSTANEEDSEGDLGDYRRLPSLRGRKGCRKSKGKNPEFAFGRRVAANPPEKKV